MKCLFIYNPQSGKGKLLKHMDYIKTKLCEKFEEVNIVSTKSKDDLIEQIKTLCPNYDVLVFSGGDGTVNDVVNVIKTNNINIILGYIPSGTCNDFARSVGIPKNYKKAIKKICEGTPKEFDGFCANGRFGVYVCASGIFTSASYETKQKTKHFFGKLGYYLHSAKEIFSAKSLDIEFSLDNKQKQTHNSVLFLLTNSSSVAGWNFNKHTNLHDGKMEFISIETKKKNKKIGLHALLTIVKMFLFGINSVKNNKLVKFKQFSKINLTTKQPCTINIDGENGGTGEINLEVCSEMFTLIV